MKKYLLWLMITWLSIVSFTLADTVQISCTPEGCTPYWENNPLPAPNESTTVKIVNDENCDDRNLQAVQTHSQYWPSYTDMSALQNWMTWYANATLYFRMNPEEARGNCTVSIEWLPAYEWWNEWWNTWWWTEWWWESWWESWWIVAGGISAFSWITERLGNIAGEFLPYMVYIAIACLGIALLFKALKYLLWFTSNQSQNSISGRSGMQERRNRRRRNRRFQRAIHNYRTKGGETYGQYYRRNNKLKFWQNWYNSRRY